MGTGWVHAELGSGTTGKLGCAWVGAWVGAWVYGVVMMWWGGENACIYLISISERHAVPLAG